MKAQVIFVFIIAFLCCFQTLNGVQAVPTEDSYKYILTADNFLENEGQTNPEKATITEHQYNNPGNINKGQPHRMSGHNT